MFHPLIASLVAPHVKIMPRKQLFRSFTERPRINRTFQIKPRNNNTVVLNSCIILAQTVSRSFLRSRPRSHPERTCPFGLHLPFESQHASFPCPHKHKSLSFRPGNDQGIEKVTPSASLIGINALRACAASCVDASVLGLPGMRSLPFVRIL